MHHPIRPATATNNAHGAPARRVTARVAVLLALALAISGAELAGTASPASAWTRYHAAVTANLRSGPGTGYPVVQTIGAGTPIDVVCAVLNAENIGGNRTWLLLTGGQYISDYVADTPSFNSLPPGVPACGGAPTPAPSPAPTPAPAPRPVVAPPANPGQSIGPAPTIAVPAGMTCNWPRCVYLMNRQQSRDFADGYSPPSTQSPYLLWIQFAIAMHRIFARWYVDHGMCVGFNLLFPGANPTPVMGQRPISGMFGFRC